MNYSDKENVNILTAQLVAQGVKHVVVCPGSRNAPLVHNFSMCGEITCHLVTDERSAGFVALGLSQQVDGWVAVCVTSGSAVLNVIPAAAEATYQHCGIVVISADRPQEWIGQLDGQTYPQADAMGRAVGMSVNLPEVRNDEDRWFCNRLLNEAFMTLARAPYPSVHINIPISEPLFGFGNSELGEVLTVGYGKWDEDRTRSEVIREIEKAKRPMMVFGQMSRYELSEEFLIPLSQKIVVLAEPLSVVNGMCGCVDEMMSVAGESLYPDLVVYLGGHTVSKRLRQFLRGLPEGTRHILVSDDGKLHDVSKHTGFVVEGQPGKVVADINMQLEIDGYEAKEFHREWMDLRSMIADKRENYVPSYSQMLIVKMFEEYFNGGYSPNVYYANSSAIRLAAIFARHYCYCNRGLNGIEGSLSVAVGASIANPENRVYCVIGDLSFLYDENALWQNELSGNLRILLLNNHQGGIFRNLKGLERSEVRDSYISARHNVSAEGICRQFGVDYLRAVDVESLREGLKILHTKESDCPILLEAVTDVNEDEKAYKKYYEHIKK